MTREEAIAGIIQGFRFLRMLELVRFKVVCEGGACWSRDTILLEDLYFGKPASDNAKAHMERALRKVLVDALVAHEDGENFGSTAHHSVLLKWVDKFPLTVAEAEAAIGDTDLDDGC